MNDSLPEALRDAARDALPSGAFLRRDRGAALFITDAPRHRPQSLRLFALGVRILDGESGAEAYDRLLRRRMAVCLRSGGGGLYACALIKYLIERK